MGAEFFEVVTLFMTTLEFNVRIFIFNHISTALHPLFLLIDYVTTATTTTEETMEIHHTQQPERRT
jgi:hypothetical protein